MAQATQSSLSTFQSRGAIYRVGAIAVALLFIAIIILFSGESPLPVIGALFNGAFGTADQFGRVVNTLTVLLICACGLVFTFTAGLYNLGVEGQLTAGAIGAMLALRTFGVQDLPEGASPQVGVIALSILFGMIGGALWALLAGLLNVFGKISEIFAGLGLNFVAQALAIYLIFGPWKRTGVASMSGTEPLNESLWLGTFGRTEATPVGVVLAFAFLVLTVVVMRGTHFGLRLRAVGRNLRASYVLGIPSTQYLLSSFLICGALAGVAGALQIIGNFHRLIPTISGNLGFLALLVVMLVNFNALFVLPIAFFFSALNVGSLQLPLVVSDKVDSSLSGVIQGALVLFALIGRGLAETRARKGSG
jgi:simple sugar transport system permease protein